MSIINNEITAIDYCIRKQQFICERYINIFINKMGNQCCSKPPEKPVRTATIQIQEEKALISTKYKIKTTLGKEGQKLFLMENKERKLCVVKMFVKSKMTPQEVLSNKKLFTVLRSLDHPNIVKPIQIVDNEQNFFLVYEYCEGGDLFQHLELKRKFTELEAGIITEILLKTIDYTLGKGIIHRNLKLHNIIMEKRDSSVAGLKLCNFSQKTYSFKGKTKIDQSIYYKAPQIINNQPITSAIDVYAIGIILFRMLNGLQYPPFVGNTNQEIASKIKLGNFNKQAFTANKIGKQPIDLVTKMLSVNPKDRPTIVKCLQNSWLKSFVGRKTDIKQNFDQNRNQLSNFNKANKLAASVEKFIFDKYSNNQQNQKLTQIFKKMDRNGDGTVTKQQVKEAAKDPSLNQSTKLLMEQIMKSLPGQKISYSSFLLALSNKKKLMTQERVSQVFKKIDKDGSGKIQKSQLLKVIKGQDNAQVLKMLNEADKDKDGMISLQEWKKMLITSS